VTGADYSALNTMPTSEVLKVFQELKDNPRKDNFDWENTKILIHNASEYFNNKCGNRNVSAMCDGFNMYNSSRTKFTNHFLDMQGQDDLEAATFFYCLDQEIKDRLSGPIKLAKGYNGKIVGSAPTVLFIPFPEIKLRYPHKIIPSIEINVDNEHIVEISTQCKEGFCIHMGRQHKCSEGVHFTQYSILSYQLLFHNDILFFGKLELNNEATCRFIDKFRVKQPLQVVHLLDPIDPCDFQILFDFYHKHKPISDTKKNILEIGKNILSKCPIDNKFVGGMGTKKRFL